MVNCRKYGISFKIEDGMVHGLMTSSWWWMTSLLLNCSESGLVDGGCMMEACVPWSDVVKLNSMKMGDDQDLVQYMVAVGCPGEDDEG